MQVLLNVYHLIKDSNVVEMLAMALQEAKGKPPLMSTFEKDRWKEAKEQTLLITSKDLLIRTIRKTYNLRPQDRMNS